MLVAIKKNHLSIIFILYYLWSLWAIISLSGCNQISKNSHPGSEPIDGNVTLLWNEIPNAKSYNIYMSTSPGVTKLSGLKIENVTNPAKINQLEPGRTYYFVVTVVNGSGESKESKELSYTAIEDKIGLIYWKDLFDESIEYHKSNTAEIRQEIKAKPERVVESENIKPTIVPAETGTDQNLLASKKVILKKAQDLSNSDFYIFFKQNSNELSSKAIGKLDRIYEILTSNSASKLTLNGYSDSSGAPAYNQMLSEIRAFSVKSYLTGKGINPSRIVALGHGAQKFIASNKIAEGRGLNRRVEIELITP